MSESDYPHDDVEDMTEVRLREEIASLAQSSKEGKMTPRMARRLDRLREALRVVEGAGNSPWKSPSW